MTLQPCTRCGTPKPRRQPCPSCGYTPRRQQTTSQRGYGSQHQRTRVALLANAYGQPCPICTRLMLPNQALDLDHTTPLALDPSSTGDRIVHASCNRGRGDGSTRNSSKRAPDPARFPRKTAGGV